MQNNLVIAPSRSFAFTDSLAPNHCLYRFVLVIYILLKRSEPGRGRIGLELALYNTTSHKKDAHCYSHSYSTDTFGCNYLRADVRRPLWTIRKLLARRSCTNFIHMFKIYAVAVWVPTTSKSLRLTEWRVAENRHFGSSLLRHQHSAKQVGNNHISMEWGMYLQ